MIEETHRDAMKTRTVTGGNRDAHEAFMEQGKTGINELLWLYLPKDTTLGMAEIIACDFWKQIARRWEIEMKEDEG